MLRDNHGNVKNLLYEAIEYRRRGWSVIPVIGKRPALQSWTSFQTHRADENTLRNIFDHDSITGLGVITGVVSGGLAIRDFDQADGYHKWASEYPAEANSLPTAETHRGFHVYGRRDAEDFRDFGDGELRMDSKHYTVLPPSRHPEGSVYRWLIPLPTEGVQLPLLPESLTQQLRHPTEQQHRHHIACVNPAVREAIEATLPTGPGQRNRQIFEFARRLKAITDLDRTPAMVRAIFSEWHRTAFPVIRTKDFSTSWQDFKTAWVRARPYGASLQAAFDTARKSPHPPIEGNARLGILAAACEALSAGGQPFFLSCHSAGEYLGVSHETARLWLIDLQYYGVIELVTKGTAKDRKATVWRYLKGVSK